MFRRKSFARKYAKRRGVKRVYKRRSYAPKKRVTPLKKMIRKEISRNIENKTVQAYNYNFPIYPATSANFLNNVYELGPSGGAMTIPQGTGQANCIGNTIKTKKLTWKGTIVPLAWDTATNPNPRPQQVKLYIFYDKIDPTAVPDPRTNFFQNGNSSKGFQDDLADNFSPINTDRYRVLTTRTFKLGFSQYAGTASSAANQGAWQAFSNNDFKLNCNFSIDLTKYYPQIVKYNDTNNVLTTRGLYALWTTVAADGAVWNAAWVTAATQFVQTYEYEDA